MSTTSDALVTSSVLVTTSKAPVTTSDALVTSRLFVLWLVFALCCQDSNLSDFLGL